MNHKIILIHPQDPSTSFLEAIISFLERGNFPVKVFKPGSQPTNLNAEIEACYEEGDILVFLGHGSSRELYGSANEQQEKTILFSTDQAASFFSNKKNILLACRSAELLINANPSGEYVGFGDLPTSIEEVLGARELSTPYYLRGLEDATLALFRNVLIEMMIDAFKFSKDTHSLRTFYLALRYSLNRALTRIATSKSIPLLQKQLLFQIIQETKNEMIHQ
jgi:hypothetical protein